MNRGRRRRGIHLSYHVEVQSQSSSVAPSAASVTDARLPVTQKDDQFSTSVVFYSSCFMAPLLCQFTGPDAFAEDDVHTGR